MTGKDKVKLLIIGKSKKLTMYQRCLDGNTASNVHSQQEYRMTSVLFEEWITNWDAALRKEGHKIFVLFNSFSAHSQKIMLTNKWLEFLYTNLTSCVHPIDMGVIKNLKTFYRKDLAQMMIDLPISQNYRC